MTRRAAALGVLLCAGCAPELAADCPPGTVSTAGGCQIGCERDLDCLVNEVCGAERACAPGEGAPPSVVSFRAAEGGVLRGRPAQLVYSVANAERVDIEPRVLSGGTSLEGRVWTPPLSETTRFRLVAYGPGGHAQAEVQVELGFTPAPPTIVRFTASPSRVRPGELVQLAWDVAGAERVEIHSPRAVVHRTGDGAGSVAFFPTEPTSLSLQAINAAGTSVSDVRVNLDLPGPAVDSFEASERTALAGATVLLRWATREADGLRLVQGGTTLYQTRDPAEVAAGRFLAPLPEVTTESELVYELLLSAAGQEIAPVPLSVGVVPAPSLLGFTVSPERFDPGAGQAPVELGWSAERAASLAVLMDSSPLAPGGPWPLVGAAQALVAGTTRFELILAGPAGSARASRRVWAETPDLGTPERAAAPALDGRAVIHVCRAGAGEVASWYQLPISGPESARIVVWDSTPDCSAEARGATLELYRDDLRVGAVSQAVSGACPRIDPAAHEFARGLDPDAGGYWLRVSQPSATCGAFTFAAERVPAACGNGIRERGEACDDGNTLRGDGCRSDCTLEPGSAYEVSLPGAVAYGSVSGTALTFQGYDPGRPATDEGLAEVALPFPFTFFGRSYTTLSVAVDGYASFSGRRPAAAGADAPARMGTPGGADGLIALAWGDLALDAGAQVVVATLGSAPSRRFVIEWQNARSLHASGTFLRLTGQIVLEEGSNTVELRYGPSSQHGADAHLLWAGIETPTGRFGYAIERCGDGCRTDRFPRDQLVSFRPAAW